MSVTVTLTLSDDQVAELRTWFAGYMSAPGTEPYNEHDAPTRKLARTVLEHLPTPAFKAGDRVRPLNTVIGLPLGTVQEWEPTTPGHVWVVWDGFPLVAHLHHATHLTPAQEQTQ